jgi:putative endonuclease
LVISIQLTRFVLKALDWAAVRLHRTAPRARHLITGARGEEDAYFHLRTLGYVMVARNFRSAKRKGEVDLIAWDGDTLCFIEVKTRSRRDFIPAEAAVDHAKRDELRRMAREYMQRIPGPPPHRFDVISVYYGDEDPAPNFELIKAAFGIK